MKLVKIFIPLFILLLLAVFALDRWIMPNYVNNPETKVPNLIGLQQQDAIAILEKQDLEPVIKDTTYTNKYPRGSIMFQQPKPGKIVKIGRKIYLFVSGGEPVIAVPNLIGKSLRDAKFSLERIGLALGKIDSFASNNPKNMIFDQQFAEGTPLKVGDSVGVSLSLGKYGGEIVVPNLIGKSLAEAQKILLENSLEIGKINYQRSLSLLPNTILDQYPSSGSRLNPGDKVDLFVTKVNSRR